MSVPIIVALISFVVFFPLGVLTYRWLLKQKKATCRHRWRMLLEKYPTFTQDRWQCDECGTTENFPHDQPPTKTVTDICNMGHVHIAGYPEWEEWPDVDFVNEDEDTRDLLRPDALRFRMFLSKFLQRVKQAERTTGDLLQFEKKEVGDERST